MAVSARLKDPKGAVYVYDWLATQNSWTERGDYISLWYVNSIGHEIAMTPDGNTIVTATDHSVVIFDWVNNAWTVRGRGGDEVVRIDGDGLLSHSHILVDVSHDGKKVVVGLPDDEDGYFKGKNIGQVQTYVWQ